MGLCLLQCWCRYDSSWYVIHRITFRRTLDLDLIRTTSFVLGQSTLTARTALSVTLNTLIILSTIHSQDFRDRAGDKRAGRWTIPMEWPKGSRISMLVILTTWSVGLSWACGLVYVLSVPFCVFAVFIGLRFIQKRRIDDDKLSYQYYNVRFPATNY
jgi:4-hydroxybenzoate polyprenyltransferase